MAIRVPDTNTFSLQDVVNAVENHAGNISDNLSACFSNAISVYFDSNYNNDTYAVANSLKRFRNYGPNENPTSGTFTLPIPSYGARVVGRLVYMSPDGTNLFVLASIMYSTQVDMIFRFTLSIPFDLNTISYCESRSTGGIPISGYIWRTMRFHPDGSRLMLLADSHMIGEKNCLVRTFVLSPAWNIASPVSSYDTYLQAYYPNDSRRAVRMAFTESGNTLFVYDKLLNNQVINCYNLSSPYVIGTGTVNANYRFVHGTTFMANTIHAFEVWDESLSIDVLEIGLGTSSGYVNMGNIQLDSNPWYAYYSFIQHYLFDTFKVSDVYTMRGKSINYFLESNTDVSDPLNPRINCKLMYAV